MFATRTDAATDLYETQVGPVPVRSKIFATPADVVRALGIARVIAGASLTALPRVSTRALGVDSAGAKRMAFLARMVGGRDLVIGVGTLGTAGTPAGTAWVVAGAASDAVDAVAVLGAVRVRVVARWPALAVVAAATGGSAAGAWCALRLHRS